MTNHSHVVIGYDFTETSHQALVRGFGIAARAPMHVLHVVCVIERHQPISVVGPGPVDYRYAERVQQTIADEIAGALAAADIAERVQFFVHVRFGKPAEEILEVARELGADLILVGTKGLTGIPHLMIGSVAERVVREAGCTVEVVRPKTYGDIELLKITGVEHEGHYIPPHRYFYEDRRVMLRPDAWPLY